MRKLRIRKRRVKKNKPEIVYRIRRGMTQIYITLSLIIGTYLSLIGTGIESENPIHPEFYWIGIILLISGITILSIYTSVIDEKIRENEVKISNHLRRK